MKSANLWFNRLGMLMRRLLIILGVIWLAVACSPVDPTRPPTRTPTLTVVRPSLPAATAEETQVKGTVGPGRSQTPAVPRSANATPTASPLPTIDPLACLPDDPGETGLVSWVIDGETFVVDQAGRRETVRLLGVNAVPLTNEITRGLLERQVVRLVPDKANKDEHGRLLRYVLLLDGRFVNDELLRSGAARLDKDVLGLSCMVQFNRAEDYAIQEGLGLWAVAAVAELPATPTGQVTAPADVGGVLSATPAATLTPAPTLTSQTGGATVIAQQPFPTDTPGGSSFIPTQPGQTPAPSSTLAATATGPQATGTVVGTGVQIVYIFYEGVKSASEPDEFIEIKNFETTPVDISYWLINAEANQNWYVFPEFTIQPGQSCRLYTNEINDDSCVPESFLTPLDDWEVWDNTADCGFLYDYLEANPVSTKCYGQ